MNLLSQPNYIWQTNKRLASSHRKIDCSDTVGVHPITTLYVFGELLGGLNTMTRILRRWTTRKMAMAKEKRSLSRHWHQFSTTLSSLKSSPKLTTRSQIFSLSVYCYGLLPRLTVSVALAVILLWLVVAPTYCVQRQFERRFSSRPLDQPRSIGRCQTIHFNVIGWFIRLRHTFSTIQSSSQTPLFKVQASCHILLIYLFFMW